MQIPISSTLLTPRSGSFKWIRIFAVACCVGTLLAACGKSDQSGIEGSSGTRDYAYGKKIDFSSSGDSQKYRVSGWADPEAEASWTDGNSAILEFKVQPTTTPVKLTATVMGFVKPPELAVQPVDVVVNGEPVAHWEVAGKGEVSSVIPASLIPKDGTLRIQFTIPKATSPHSLGLSIDDRKLGLRVFDLVLQQ
jgi:hypothetical protein